MSDLPSKKFSDKEIKKIISHALEIQKKEGTADSNISLSELEEMGGELGISRELIRRAVQEVRQGTAGEKRNKFLGENPVVIQKAVCEQKISEDTLQALLTFLPTVAGGVGSGQVHKNRLFWGTIKKQEENPSTEIIIGPAAGGKSVITVQERHGATAWGVYGGMIGGLGLGGGLAIGLGVGLNELGSVLFPVLVPLAFLGGSYLLARLIYTLTIKSRKKVLKRILQKIQQFLEHDQQD